MKRTLTICFCLLLTTLSSATLAAPAFDEVDTDHDGWISETEAGLIEEGLDFSAADANGDGHLDETEYEMAYAQ
jgi:hypothetical protein